MTKSQKNLLLANVRIRIEELLMEKVHTTREIVNTVVLAYPKWLELERAKFDCDKNVAMRRLVVYVQRTCKQLQREGYDAAFKPSEHIKGLSTRKLTPSEITAWFLVVSHVDSLSWRQKKEIKEALGI